MTENLLRVLATGAAALLAVACSQAPSAPQPSASEPAATSAAEEVGPIRSTGVVTAVDAAAGTITLDHQAIPAINWPAMTMQFNAEDPSILQGIAAGDRVAFELKSSSETSVVTLVQRQ